MLTSRETDEMLNHRLVAFHVDLFIRLMEACIEGKIVQAQAHMNVRIIFVDFLNIITERTSVGGAALLDCVKHGEF